MAEAFDRLLERRPVVFSFENRAGQPILALPLFRSIRSRNNGNLIFLFQKGRFHDFSYKNCYLHLRFEDTSFTIGSRNAFNYGTYLPTIRMVLANMKGTEPCSGHLEGAPQRDPCTEN